MIVKYIIIDSTNKIYETPVCYFLVSLVIPIGVILTKFIIVKLLIRLIITTMKVTIIIYIHFFRCVACTSVRVSLNITAFVTFHV